MSRFALADDTLAVLKLVQACIGWGSRELWFRFVPRGLSLWARIDPLPELSDLPQRLERALSAGQDGPERDLAFGLCHFLPRRCTMFEVATWDLGAPCDRQQLTESVPVRQHPRFGRARGVSVHIFWKVGSPLNLEVTSLRERTCFAPADVTFEAFMASGVPGVPLLDRLRTSWILEYHRLSPGGENGSLASRHLFTARFHFSRFQRAGQAGSALVAVRAVGRIGEKPADALPHRSATVTEKLKRATDSAYCPLNSGIVFLSRSGLMIYPVKRGVLLEPIFADAPGPRAP